MINMMRNKIMKSMIMNNFTNIIVRINKKMSNNNINKAHNNSKV